MIKAKISLWFNMSSFEEIHFRQKRNTQISVEKVLYLEKTLVLIQAIRRNFVKNINDQD